MILAADHEFLFPGYRSVGMDGRFGRSRSELYSSIEHFYQSEKFRGSDEPLRQRIIDAPTPREARKLAQRNSEKIRPNWEDLRIQAMGCAILMKMREHRAFAEAVLAYDGEADYPTYPFCDHFWGQARAGVSRGMYSRLLTRVRDKVAGGTVRLLATGSPTFHNRFLFQVKLQSLLKQTRPDVLLIGCAKGCDELAEKWALERLIPVRHIPTRGGRRSAERQRLHEALVRSSTHIAIFTQGDVATEDLVSISSRSGKPLRVIRVDSNGRATK